MLAHLKTPSLKLLSHVGDCLVYCQHTRSFDSEMFPTTFRLSALLLSVGNLITFKSCGGQLTQLVSTFSQLSVADAKTSSSWYHSKPSSLLNKLVSESVSQSVSDKHSQTVTTSFELPSSPARVTSIKFTKRESVSQLVSQ